MHFARNGVLSEIFKLYKIFYAQIIINIYSVCTNIIYYTVVSAIIGMWLLHVLSTRGHSHMVKSNEEMKNNTEK